MILLALLPLAVLVKMCAGSRVLVVFPVPSRAHSILGDSVVRTLLDAGHEMYLHRGLSWERMGAWVAGTICVMLYRNINIEVAIIRQVTYVTPAPGGSTTLLKHVNISSGVTGGDLLPKAEFLDRPPPISYPLQLGVAIAEKALQHEAMQELLRDPTASFDLVIADWYYSSLFAPLASLYDCPLIWYTSSDLHWQSLRLVHEASSPTYTVDHNSRGLPAMPFVTWERACQLWLQMYLSAWSYYMTNYVELPAYWSYYHHAMSIRGRPMPEYHPLIYNASMLLVNSHPPVGQAIPLPHNVKYIGGHHVELPIQPLPMDLKRVMDKARNGVIFICLEPNLKSYLPEIIKHQLVELFRRLEQIVLWNTREIIDDLPRNLHILQEAPKISILNHPNTLMLITHGDMISITEAAHCGVPVIGIPVLGDQFVNVDLAVARGWAVRVDYSTDLAIGLNDAINEIIGEFGYRSSAKLVSSTFRRRPTPAHAELLHWVHLAMDTRGANYLRSPALHLPTTERLYLDIIVVVLAVVYFLSKVLKIIKIHLRDEDFDKKYQ